MPQKTIICFPSHIAVQNICHWLLKTWPWFPALLGHRIPIKPSHHMDATKSCKPLCVCVCARTCFVSYTSACLATMYLSVVFYGCKSICVPNTQNLKIPNLIASKIESFLGTHMRL